MQKQKKYGNPNKISRMILSCLFSLVLFLSSQTVKAEAVSTDQMVYLSDLAYVPKTSSSYLPGESWTTYSRIIYDKTAADAKITILINGAATSFEKGIWAHATSNLVYDLSDYDYDYFTAYLGLNTTAGGNGDGVKFYIYTSMDGLTWDLKTNESPAVMKGNTNSQFVSINIEGVKYLRLYADQFGGNGSDHAVYADAKLVTKDYFDQTIQTIEEYDRLIKEQYQLYGSDTEKYELLLLQRDLVSKVGYYPLQYYITESQAHKETISWLMNDVDLLKLYLEGGTPRGTYLNSFDILGQLYHAYKADLTETKTTENGVFLSQIYTKMMITLSLTHASDVSFWIYSTGTATPNPNVSVATTRYEIYKNMLTQGKLNTKVFETLEVEEMRYVMGSFINDDEILWLHDYTSNIGSQNPYSFITYKNVDTSLYRSDTFFLDYQSTWEERYQLAGYGVANIQYYPKLWMIMNIGGVCWQISNLGQNIRTSYGMPSTVIGQPGHSAYLYYDLDASGQGVWIMMNDVFGWKSSNTSGYAGSKGYYLVRLLNGWGNGKYAKSNTVSYILLGQAALNDYENYSKAEEILRLAQVYQEDTVTLEQLYRKALSIQKINLDAWEGLVDLYLADASKTEEDYYLLAEEIATNLKYYPLPMVDLLAALETNVTTSVMTARFAILQNQALTQASIATDEVVLQSNIVRHMAQYLLGVVDTSVAEFSFDGEKAGILSLASRYEDSEVRWDYSFDGGDTWTEVGEHSIALSETELQSITAENDIKVHLIGTEYGEENIYTIDILSSSMPTNFYNNDRENKIITENTSAYDVAEWRLSEDDPWERFTTSLPDLTGDKTLFVRIAGHGVYLPSTTVTYQFTADQDPDTAKYIPIARLSLTAYSSQNSTTEGALKTIDGNRYTMWHNNYGKELDRYIVLKLDQSEYLSALEYYPRYSGSNGYLTNGTVYVSMDAVNWTEVATISKWASNNQPKMINFDTVMEALYVKLAWENTGTAGFASASMINLFMDQTKTSHHLEAITYDHSTTTDQNVLATIHFTRDTTILNEDLAITKIDSQTYSYLFTDNGKITIQYRDDVSSVEGTQEIEVTWIDRTNPVAEIYYDTMTDTNQNVTATIKFNKPVTILDHENFIAISSTEYIYIFDENDTFDFTFADQLVPENQATATLHVDWIDKTLPQATVTYETISSLDQKVRATITFSEAVTILNSQDGLFKIDDVTYYYDFQENGSFDLEFVDAAGNQNTQKVEVTSIDRIAPVATVSYDFPSLTNQNVTATISFSEPVIITIGEGLEKVDDTTYRYLFKQNGQLHLEFKDMVGNFTEQLINVDWIDKTLPKAEIEYNVTDKTEGSVTVTLHSKENIIILNNDGSDTYTFTENGEFTFVFQDLAGNQNEATANVTWIVAKESSEPSTGEAENPAQEESQGNASTQESVERQETLAENEAVEEEQEEGSQKEDTQETNPLKESDLSEPEREEEKEHSMNYLFILIPIAVIVIVGIIIVRKKRS